LAQFSTDPTGTDHKRRGLRGHHFQPDITLGRGSGQGAGPAPRRWSEGAGLVTPGGPASQNGSWPGRLADAVDFARRQVTGEGEVDEFGFDPEFNTRLLMPLARLLYQQWFRVRM